MSETGRHPKLPLVVRGEFHPHVPAKGGAAAPDVHRHVPHHPAHHRDELPLRVGLLEVQAAEDAAGRTGPVVLDEGERQPGLRVARSVERLQEEAAGITNWFAPPGAEILREEVFGPVLTLQTFVGEDDAVRMANDSHYGLAAYVWTHDIGTGLRTAHSIESGWVQVNQGLGQVPGMSYGGYKQSGIGREFSLEGMLDSFTQRKSVTVNLAV